MIKLRNILLIDDDPICTWLNKSFLEDLKISDQIICHSDGLSALEYLQQICQDSSTSEALLPDLIFLDLNMPVVDGFEFLQKINALPGCSAALSERVVVLTTSMHSKDLEKAKNFKIKEYLTKPLTYYKIKSLLEQLQAASLKLKTVPAGVLDRAPYERALHTDLKPATKDIK